MQPCPGCHRYIRGNESSCPFCSTLLRSDPAPVPRGLAAMALVVGLALAGCTDDGMSEGDVETETGGDADSSTGDTGTETSSTEDGESTTTDTDTESSTLGPETDTTDDDSGMSTETYAGPDPGDWTDTTDTGAWDTETGTDTGESTT